MQHTVDIYLLNQDNFGNQEDSNEWGRFTEQIGIAPKKHYGNKSFAGASLQEHYGIPLNCCL